MNNNYTSENIQVLDSINAIRLRPEMYIGSRDNPNILYKEVIDNCCDEFFNGYLQSSIIIKYIEEKNKLIIRDSGRGLPIDIHKKFNKPTMEVLVTQTHSGGKFDKKSFKVSSGLNGVGITCVNALSSYMKITSTRDGYDYYMEFSKGKKTSTYKRCKTKNKFKSGTTVEFIPDETIFENPKFDIPKIIEDIENRTYINSKLKIIFINGNDKKVYYNEDGIKNYINILNKKPLISPIYHTFKDEKDNMYEMVFNYTNTDEEIIKSFVNGLNVRGTCETGFKMGLTNSIINFIKKNNLLPKKLEKLEIKGDDIRMGLVCLINIRHSNPLYKNQTKDEISNSDMIGIFKKTVNEIFTTWMEKNPDLAKKLCNRIIQFAKGRSEANKIKDKIININNSSAGLSFSEKFADCTSNDPEESELFIAEGKSASGNIRKCRIAKTQAVFPLRGKPLNVYGIENSTILKNDEFKELIKIIFGTTNIREINYDKVRYHKICFASDADFDGLHIQSLLTLFFWEKFPKLFDLGYIYVCLPPKYRTSVNGKFVYFKNDEDLNKFLFNRAKNTIILHSEEITLKKFITNMYEFEKYYDIIKRKYSISDDVINIILHENNLKSIVKSLKNLNLNVIDKKVTGMNDGIWHDFNLDDIDADIKNLLKIIPIKNRFDYEDDKGNIIKNSTTIDCIRYINKKLNIKLDYFKGLGEASSEELFDTTIDPEKRNLYQLKPKNKEDIDKIMKDLFGSNTEARKIFIKDF